MRWTFALILPILALSAPGCTSPEREWPYVVEIGGAKVNVEVAVTVDERARGLMYRDRLGDDWGMLFVFAREQPLSFWMHETKVPLSVAFIGDDLVVRDVQDMQPMSDTTHDSAAPARYALEVNQGWFKDHGIKPGDKVTFSAGLAEYLLEKHVD